MLHGDKVLGKVTPEVIGKTHYLLLSSKEGVEKNHMASIYWKILDALQKKEMSSGENWPFFASKY